MDDVEKLTCTVPEAGRMLGIGRDAAYQAAKRGDIPVLRMGKRLIVPLVALKKKIENAGEPEAPAA